tara:strand:+ start:1694 stop:1810 length:117 start_codon:yes stop_codon:yes gene_type:complete
MTQNIPFIERHLEETWWQSSKPEQYPVSETEKQGRLKL